jgi:hypothetical protein
MKELTLNELYPESGKVLLSGSGRAFVKRLGEEVIKEAVLGVLKGENLRSQTEHLTRSRITQVSASLVMLYLKGSLTVPKFSDKLVSLSIRQLTSSKRSDTALMWPAQWFLGLTGKSVENVLKGDHSAMHEYGDKFTEVMQVAIDKTINDFGNLKVVMGLVKQSEKETAAVLGWKDMLLLTTAIGAQTLTIRGSDKSMYGKLFEKLVLGSILTILGFKRIDKPTDAKILSKPGVFWLSDSGNTRECDATVLYSPYKLARFDIGFIGPGNPEISKDKLSRFSTEENYLGIKTYTKTFIVVDRLPKTSKTASAAREINADIIQMSMKYWPKELASKMAASLGLQHKLLNMPDTMIAQYLEDQMKPINILEFLNNVVMDSDITDITDD